MSTIMLNASEILIVTATTVAGISTNNFTIGAENNGTDRSQATAGLNLQP